MQSLISDDLIISTSLASSTISVLATSLTSTDNLYLNINNNLDLDHKNTQTGIPTH
jgi:hypothetical protein